MDDLLHSVGISLDLKEFNRCFRTGAIDSAVPLSIIWPDMPSGPDALPFILQLYTGCLCLEVRSIGGEQ